MDNWHILIVEDENDGREIVAEILGFFGITADLATNGQDALDLLETNTYTAAIIDLMLPGMSGFELAHAIRMNPKTAHLPCIAVTAYHSTRIKQQALTAGFMGYHQKPLDDTGFIKELRRVVEGR